MIFISESSISASDFASVNTSKLGLSRVGNSTFVFRIAVFPAFVGTATSRGPRGGSDEQGSYSGRSVAVRRGVYPRVSRRLGQSSRTMRSQDRNRALAVSVFRRRSSKAAITRLFAASTARYCCQLLDHFTKFRTIFRQQATRYVIVRCCVRARYMGTVEGSCEVP